MDRYRAPPTGVGRRLVDGRFPSDLHLYWPSRSVRVHLGVIDRGPGDRDPDHPDPLVCQADSRVSPDAADPARDAEDPEEVQGQDRSRAVSYTHLTLPTN